MKHLRIYLRDIILIDRKQDYKIKLRIQMLAQIS